MRLKPLLPLIAIGLLASGCAAQGGFGGIGPRDACGNPALGGNTVIGAGAGALGGGLLGNMAGNRGGRNARTLGGAAVGALAGGLVGAMTEPAREPCYPQGQYVAPQSSAPIQHHQVPRSAVPAPTYSKKGH